MKAAYFLIYILILPIFNLLGQTAGEVNFGSSTFLIHKNLFHLKDSTYKINIVKAIELQKAGKFSLLKSKTIRQEFGLNTAPRWFYFQINSAENREMMLQLEYNNIDQLELFEVKNNQIKSLGLTGDVYNFSQRPYINNNYVFPINLTKGQPAQYFLYINQPNSILSFTIELLPKYKFTERDHRQYLTWGIFIGIICIVLVVNLVMWLATKDRIYIWYSLYVHFMTMHLFADAGLAFQYLWPNSPVINSYHPVYLYIWLGLIVQVKFMRKFIHQTAQNSRVYQILNWFRYFVLLCLLAVFVIRLSGWAYGNVHLFQSIAFISSMFVPAIFLLTMISLFERRHDRELLVKYYGWAVILQFVGYMFVAFVTYLQTANLKHSLPFDLLSYIIIGSILLFDILFFSFGLAFRYKNSIKNNQKLALQLVNAKQVTQQKVIMALENDRKRLAQDLHDDLGATLSTAKGYLSMLYRGSGSNNLAQSTNILDEVSSEMRSISHLLMPKAFANIGLKNAIEESIHKIQRENTNFEFITFGETIKLDEQIEIIIFRIVTEIFGIINANTSANEVQVQLVYHADNLIIMIEHNGTYTYTSGQLFKNIYAKSEFIKADFLIENNQNGHTLILKIDLPKKLM